MNDAVLAKLRDQVAALPGWVPNDQVEAHIGPLWVRRSAVLALIDATSAGLDVERLAKACSNAGLTHGETEDVIAEYAALGRLAPL